MRLLGIFDRLLQPRSLCLDATRSHLHLLHPYPAVCRKEERVSGLSIWLTREIRPSCGEDTQPVKTNTVHRMRRQGAVLLR